MRVNVSLVVTLLITFDVSPISDLITMSSFWLLSIVQLYQHIESQFISFSRYFPSLTNRWPSQNLTQHSLKSQLNSLSSPIPLYLCLSLIQSFSLASSLSLKKIFLYLSFCFSLGWVVWLLKDIHMSTVVEIDTLMLFFSHYFFFRMIIVIGATYFVQILQTKYQLLPSKMFCFPHCFCFRMIMTTTYQHSTLKVEIIIRTLAQVVHTV